MSHSRDDLVHKKCVPCEGGIPKLSREAAESQVRALPDWRLAENAESIYRSWTARSFVAALDFFNRVGEVAEQENHHPDLHLTGYRQIRIELSTHAIGGLSDNDFILAAKIDQLPLEVKS